MKLFRFSSMVLIGLIAAVTLSAGGDKKAVVWPAGDVKWVESPAMKATTVLESRPPLKKAPSGTSLINRRPTACRNRSSMRSIASASGGGVEAGSNRSCQYG